MPRRIISGEILQVIIDAGEAGISPRGIREKLAKQGVVVKTDTFRTFLARYKRAGTLAHTPNCYKVKK